MTNKTAAIRYARALLDVAIKEKADLEQIERELAQFAGLFTQHPTLEKVLLNPAVPVPRKRAAVAELLARAGFAPIVCEAADAARRARSPGARSRICWRRYRERLLDHQNVVRAEVTTAAPLDDRARRRRSSSGLAQVTGRTVKLVDAVDPSIIGGMVARIGSTVYDGSVTRQLREDEGQRGLRRGSVAVPG